VHLDESTLERVLHDELVGSDRAVVESHLAACPECAGRLARAEQEERRLFGLLETLDHEPTPLDWAAVVAPAPRSVARPSHRPLLAASVAFLVLAGAILAAIPGSPVRAWLDSAFRGSPEDRPASTQAGGSLSGVSVVPDDPFEVAFAEPQREGRLLILFVASAAIDLTVTGEPVGLESGTDRLVISNRGSTAGYELRVPRSLESLRVTVGDETVLEKRGGSIRAPGARVVRGGFDFDLASTGR
jgi:hypothetical protein